ncbi:MAG: ABC transporter ATP-binding protein [Vicinamibacteria bacterium]
MSRGPVAVRVEGLRKKFRGDPALLDVSLDFTPGGFNTLLGPSGCGKTTLLRSIAGFVTPETGRIFIGDEDVTHRPPWTRRIGFVFQSYALWPHMNVFENVAYGLRLRKVEGNELERRVRAMLETVGLTTFHDRSPGALSGGQQQRVALARALVLEPDVLLLDEPLANLDARLRVEMRQEIRRLQKELQITTIFVTHDQEEALELSDRVAVMSHGRVEQVGSPEEVYAKPASADVAALLGGARFLVGVVSEEGDLIVDGAHLPLGLSRDLAGRRVRVAVSPRRLVVVAD